MQQEKSFGSHFGELVRLIRTTENLTQTELAEKLGTTQVQISKLENGDVDNPRQVTISGITDAFDLPDDAIVLLRSGRSAQSVFDWITERRKDELSDENSLNVKIEEILQRLGGVEAALANPSALSEQDMRALASRFGATEFSDRDQFIEFLTLKAEEYRTYKALIDGLDERVAAIGNLKGAAQGAAERLDFDTVEELLARVTEVEAEIFAESCETRARNALLRDQVDQAATILTAGADALAVSDPLAPARRKAFEFQAILYKHGLRYGGRGLSCAVAMAEDALRTLTRDVDPQDWAKAQNNFALALETLASRSDGQEAIALLNRAIAGYEDALTVRTRADYPEDWAMTQQNLAIALATLASRRQGEEVTALLTRAITSFEEALTVTTRADHPVDWAMMQQNLANVLETLARNSDKEVATDLLTRAIAVYEEALTVRTRADHPVDWAMTQQNLAIALDTLARNSDGEEAAALLNRAIAGYEEALTVITRADHPADWAMAQQNLAVLHYNWSRHPACTDPRTHLEQALTHVDAALTVYDPEHMPYYHTEATRLRDDILSALAAL